MNQNLIDEMHDPDPNAWTHLRKNQKQCDPEGIEVQVSRQALDETLDALEAADKRIDELRDALRYCSGRMEVPRCPRCADVQQVAREALKEQVDG